MNVILQELTKDLSQDVKNDLLIHDSCFDLM